MEKKKKIAGSPGVLSSAGLIIITFHCKHQNVAFLSLSSRHNLMTALWNLPLQSLCVNLSVESDPTLVSNSEAVVWPVIDRSHGLDFVFYIFFFSLRHFRNSNLRGEQEHGEIKKIKNHDRKGQRLRESTENLPSRRQRGALKKEEKTKEKTQECITEAPSVWNIEHEGDVGGPHCVCGGWCKVLYFHLMSSQNSGSLQTPAGPPLLLSSCC